VLTLLTGRYTLEVGLLAGALLMLAGLAIDVVILADYLTSPGEAMERTVHLAFFATTIVVLGLNLFFSSFLLAMMMPRRTGDQE
jgi:hypothetical protein